VAKQDPERPERFAALALGLARAGRSNDAVLTLARAESRFPDHPVLLVTVGQVWLDDGEARGDRVALMKAVEALQQAVERGAPAGTAQSLLGRALLRLGESRRALRALQIGTASLPVPPEAFDWLGEAAEAQGRFLLARDAVAWLERAVALQPQEPAYRLRLSEAQRRLGSRPS
jgi:predicted Zn-dependent protease